MTTGRGEHRTRIRVIIICADSAPNGFVWRLAVAWVMTVVSLHLVGAGPDFVRTTPWPGFVGTSPWQAGPGARRRRIVAFTG